MKKILAFTTILFFSINATAQTLPRRVFIGIRMENVTAAGTGAMETGASKGVLIREVLPNSTAGSAGIQKGDMLLSLNGRAVASTSDVFALIADLKAASALNFELLREGKIIKKNAILKPLPYEKYNGLEVVYTESSSAIGQQRIIISKPVMKKRYPVLVFIGGIGCYSLDFALDSTRTEAQLINEISRAGYMTARLEKPGEGDNAKHSKACAEVSFTEETNGYIAAINALKRREDVDSNAIFIFGHSMGGVFAPLVAQQTSIKGIIAYGTIGSNFQEYLAKTRRTIAQAYKMSPEETDDMIKDFCACSGYYFVDKLSTAEAAKKNQNCRQYLSVFDLRSRPYNDELYGYNIPALWKPFAGKALFLWGESDYISAKDDHEILAAAVNFYHPGHAEFKTVKQAAHGLEYAESFAAVTNGPARFNSKIADMVIHWLNSNA